MSSLEDDAVSPSSSSRRAPEQIKTVKFTLGRGNKTDAKLVVVHKDSITDVGLNSGASKSTVRVKDKKRMPEFIGDTMLHEDFLGPKPPKVLISVTGAAAAYNMDAKLEQLFCKGLVNAAKSTTAWIVSGGTDVGVMHYVGEANRMSVSDVPTIGFATFNKINNKHLLTGDVDTVEYDASAPPAPNTVNLNANHSHFVLIESKVDNWGEEIEARSDFEEYMCSTFSIPLCLIVVNGGPGTLNTVAQGAHREFPIVIIEGTQRAADTIAKKVRELRGLDHSHLQYMPLKPNEQQWLDTIAQYQQCVSLYNANQGPFDLEILKAILSSQHGALQQKLELAVQWNRADLADHLLEAANDNKEKPITPEDFNNVLSKALELSLDSEKPALFRLFASKGARKTEIDLNVLYSQDTEKGPVLDAAIQRLSPYVQTTGWKDHFRRARTVPRVPSTTISGSSSPLLSDSSRHAINSQVYLTDKEQLFVKNTFNGIHPVFKHYAQSLIPKFNSSKMGSPDGRRRALSSLRQSEVSMHQMSPSSRGGGGGDGDGDGEGADGASEIGKVRYTDALLWAILMGKLDLAKVVWEECTLPIHAALVASGLCKSVAKWLLNERQAFLDTAAWFEQCSVTLLEKLSYNDAKTVMTYAWSEFKYNAIEIAAKTDCKDFIGTVHAQRYLDELLYSDDKGNIPPGTNFLRVIMCVLFPFLLTPSHTYTNKVRPSKTDPSGVVPVGAWYHFYGLPYTKFWTSTFCYLGYLAFLAVVLVKHQNETSISVIEYVLWVWMFANAIEEVSQLQEEGWSYFKYTSNQMDVFIILLQICYVACSVIEAVKNEAPVNPQPSTCFLVITTIISYVRFLDVLSISKELGPLYYVLQKIINDVAQWIFIFILFAIGFQLSFMALVDDPWNPVTQGGTFMSAIYIIIGDGTAQEVFNGHVFASIIVATYSIIAQIMLVNLLIAMMGDTFNNVKENSDKDWKFYRYYMIIEYTSASFHPPPFNLLAIPLKKLLHLCRSKRTPVDREVEPLLLPTQHVMTDKQKEKFKNLMKDLKDEYLEEILEEETKTIAAVGDMARENFKLLLEEQDVKYRSLDGKISEVIQKLNTHAPASAPPPASSSSNNNNSNSVNLDAVSNALNNLVKTELGKIQQGLMQAVQQQAGEKKPEPPAHPPVTHRIQNRDIPITWSDSVTRETLAKVLHEYKPFSEWVTSMGKPENVKNMSIKSVNIQVVDLFGPRIGFVKFQAIVTNEAGQNIPGIVFMRGAAVGMLLVMRLNDPGAADHGREYTILTIQPRVPAGESCFAEIPAGMLDGGKFAGVAAKELQEETGLVITEDKLIDLTHMAYGDRHQGMYPSAGGCDEFIRLFLYRASVSRVELDGYQNKLTGLLEDGERISLKVIPLDDLWLEAPDAKALSALLLYNTLMAKGALPLAY